MNAIRMLVGLGLASLCAWSVPVLSAEMKPKVYYAEKSDVSPPLRDLLRQYPQLSKSDSSLKDYEIPNQRLPDFLRRGPSFEQPLDPTIQRAPLPSKVLVPGLAFDGYGNPDNTTIGAGQPVPPDSNGDVSPLHYINYVNVGWVVINKQTGARVAGPFAGNSFWAGFGGTCQTQNAGDPIVLYDELADRWIFSQFASPAAAGGLQCVAVSTTNDPLGPYNRYQFAIPGIDYPKLGLYSDTGGSRSGYYITVNRFSGSFVGSTMGVFDRNAILAGSPTAAFIRFDTTAADPFFAIQPGHLEGTNLPGPGTCNVFVQIFDDEIFDVAPFEPTDGYQVWRLCPDFVTPANSTLSAPILVDAGVDYDSEVCAFAECVPQPAPGENLDVLAQFTMYRAVVRVDPRLMPGTTQLVVSHTVEVGPAVNRTGIRWARIDITSPTAPVFADGGAFAPATDSHFRWMPAVAMDGDGNIAVGYSVSSATKAPSIFITGRETTDPPGTLQTEQSCFAVEPTGVQTSGALRWGDYSSMSVDPDDDCTFWYTGEYVPVTSTRGWRMRACSFSFPTCGGPQVNLSLASGSLTQSVCSPGTLAPIGINVSLNTGATDPVDMGGADALPAGITALYAPDPVTPPGTSTATISVDGSVATGVYNFDLTGTAAGFATDSLRVTANVFQGVPGAPTLLTPLNFTLDESVSPTLTWSAVPNATGYTVDVDNNSNFLTPEFTTTVTGTSVTVTPGIAADTAYFWRVRVANPCGPGGTSATFLFSTATAPLGVPVLLVDDDNNAPDTRAIYATALNTLGLTFEVFDTLVSNTTEPNLDNLNRFQSVVWMTGDNFAAASTGPSDASVLAIQSFLDDGVSGNCFLLDSQDYRFAKGSTTPFMTNYLGAATIVQDVNFTQTVGVNTFAGLGPFTLAFPTGFSNFSDRMTATAAAQIAFNGTLPVAQAGATNLTVNTPVFKTGFFSAMIPPLPTAAAESQVLGRFLQTFCGVVNPPTIPRGNLSGTVTTAGSGAPVAGMTVRARRAGVTLSRTTDVSGNYSFLNLAAGAYQMTVLGANITTATAMNVAVADQLTTDQDFAVQAAELAYNNTTLSKTLTSNTQSTSAIAISNPGTLPLNYNLTTSNYGFGLPAAGPDLARSRNWVGQASSEGLAAALTSPDEHKTFDPKVAGAVLYSEPFGIVGGSPLGITTSPTTGQVWVADLFLGQTVRFNQFLRREAIINDPIGPRTGGAATSGVAYDTVNNTLWWMDGTNLVLVEGSLTGVATGNTIPVTVSGGGLPAGVKYDQTTDAFYYIDIVADDIYSIGRTGAVRAGYPVPQTDFDVGAGLFGNGLDVNGDSLDVLVGLLTEPRANRAVITNLFGVNSGAETPFAAVPAAETFINDIVRSKLPLNNVMYVVGNATDTIFAVEPQNLVLAKKWAKTPVASGTVAPGASSTFDLTHDSTGMPFGSFQARLNVVGNYANASSPKNLGLTVLATPGFTATLTGYVGADGGAGCATATDTVPPAPTGSAVTLCFTFANTGDAILGNVAANVTPLGASLANLTLRSGSLPLQPGASASYYYVTQIGAATSTITVNATATPQDGSGNPVPGGTPQAASDSLDLTPQGTDPTGAGLATPANVAPGGGSLLTVAVNPGTSPASTGVTVSADLSAIGGSGTQSFFDDGTNGDVTGGDNTFSFAATVAIGTPAGLKTLPVAIADAQARTGTTNIVLNVTPIVGSLVGVAIPTPGVVGQGGSVLVTVAVTPGTNPASSGIGVVIDLTEVGGSATQAMFDNGTNGDVTAGDNVWSIGVPITMTAELGYQTVIATVTDAQGRTGTATATIDVRTPGVFMDSFESP